MPSIFPSCLAGTVPLGVSRPNSDPPDVLIGIWAPGSSEKSILKDKWAVTSSRERKTHQQSWTRWGDKDVWAIWSTHPDLLPTVTSGGSEEHISYKVHKRGRSWWRHLEFHRQQLLVPAFPAEAAWWPLSGWPPPEAAPRGCSKRGNNTWNQLLPRIGPDKDSHPAQHFPPLKQMSVFGCCPVWQHLPTWWQALAVCIWGSHFDLVSVPLTENRINASQHRSED